MTSLDDRIVASLRAHHDRLAALVASLSDEQLVAPSGASEWRICDVLSHLGSGAEIMVKPLRAAIDGVAPPEADNQAVWDRWNAASPREQATWFVEHDEVMVATVEALDADARAALQIDLGFLPQPVPYAVAGGMRLNEVAQHAWDVFVGLDPQATVEPEAAGLLLDLLIGPMSFMLGFSGKADALAEPAVVEVGGRGIVIEDSVALVAEPPVAPTATLTAPDEAVVRLLGGRLDAAHTPEGVTTTGNIQLDDLRRVFPGY